MNEMICPNCGTTIPPGAYICLNCGQPLSRQTPNQAAVNTIRLPRTYGIIRGFFSVLLSIILFAFLFSTVLIFIARYSTTETAVNKTVHETDMGALLEDLGFTKIITDSIDKDLLLFVGVKEEYISESIEYISESVVNMLNRESVKEFIALTVSEYIYALSNNKADFTISSNSIARLLQNNESTIKKEISKTFNTDLSSYLDYLFYNFDSNVLQEMLESGSETSRLNNFLPSVHSRQILPLKILLLNYTRLVVISVSVVLLCFLFILNRKHYRAAFICIGAVFTITGLIYALFGLPLSLVTSLISRLIGLRQSLTESLLSQARSASLNYGLIVLGAGLISILVSVIIWFVNSKKAKSV